MLLTLKKQPTFESFSQVFWVSSKIYTKIRKITTQHDAILIRLRDENTFLIVKWSATHTSLIFHNVATK